MSDLITMMAAAAGAGGGGGPVFPARDYFNTVLYTGNGSTQSITGVGFQPDMVWIKDRDSTSDHLLFNVVSGVQNYSRPNTRASEATSADSLTSFDADGFTIGSLSTINTSGNDYVAWCWKCGGAAVTNTDGTNSSQLSASSTSGVCVFEYVGSGGTATVGHGLGAAPDFYTVRPFKDNDWQAYHSALGATQLLASPNQESAAQDRSQPWNDTEPTSTVFTVNTPTPTWTNESGRQYVGFAFTAIEGFSSFGSYTGNGSSTGPVVTTDFRPSLLMIKRYDSTGPFVMLDSARSVSNPRNAYLRGSLTPNFAEATGNDVDFNGTGFQIKSTSTDINASGGSYVYLCFA